MCPRRTLDCISRINWKFTGGSGSLCRVDEGAFDHSRKLMPEV